MRTQRPTQFSRVFYREGWKKKKRKKEKKRKRNGEEKGVEAGRRRGGKYRVPARPGSKLNECVPRNTKDFHGTLLHRTRGFGGARPTFFLSPFRVLPSSVPRFAWPRGNLNGNVNSRGEHVRRGLWSIRFVRFLLFSFHPSSLSLSLSLFVLSLSLPSFAPTILIEIFRPGTRSRADTSFSIEFFSFFFFFFSQQFFFPTFLQQLVDPSFDFNLPFTIFD